MQLIYKCILLSFSQSLVIHDSRAEVQRFMIPKFLKQRFVILTCFVSMIHDSWQTTWPRSGKISGVLTPGYMLNSPLSPRDQGARVSVDLCIILADVERVLTESSAVILLVTCFKCVTPKNFTKAEQIFRLNVVVPQKEWTSPLSSFYEVIVRLTTLSILI